MDNRYIANDNTYLNLALGTGLAFFDYRNKNKAPVLVEVSFDKNFTPQTIKPIVKARAKISFRSIAGYIIVAPKSIRFCTGSLPSANKILLPAFGKGDLSYD